MTSPTTTPADPGSWDDLDELSLSTHYPIDDLTEHLQTTGRRHGWLTGTGPGAQALILAQLQRRLKRRIIVVTPDGRSGRRLAQDLQLYCETERGHEVLYFPSSDISPYGDISPDRQVTLDRLSALFSLHMEIGGQFVVIPATALVRRTIPADVLVEHADVIQVGMAHISNERLRAVLSAGGYTSVSLVEDPGTFAIRGDIVDVWSPFDPHPVRIERWGDEVYELKSFDPQSQRTLETLRETYIFPVREEVLTDDTLGTANARLNALAAELQLPSKKVRQCLDDLRAGFHVLGVEALLPAFYPKLGSLTDLLGDEDLVVTLDPLGCEEAIEHLWSVREAERERRVSEHEEFAFPVAEHYLSRDEVTAWLAERDKVLRVQRLLLMEDRGEEAPIFEFRTRTNADVVRLRKESQSTEATARALAREQIPRWGRSYGRIVFACDTSGVAHRLRQLLELEGVEVARVHKPIDPWPPTPPPMDGAVEVTVRPCSEGLRAPATGLIVVSSREVFGRTGRKARAAAAGQASRSFVETTALQSFRDLEVGDNVVHTDFGIARYGGLLRLDVDGIPGDFLLLEYADNDKLYMPVYRLGRVQRYTGGDGVRLDKLGTSGWERTKSKVKEKLKELAVDLIHLYARRQTQGGFAFPAPDSDFREFEDAFPFEETPDQLKAIEAVVSDMQQPRITDRLICGDVGFGKTEVAMRGAFLSVLAGKQVAVLVPTTVLCEQHMNTFRKRMEDFPVRIESLSRFRSRSESKQIVADLEAGKVDIIIGTHRLLSKDIRFKDLGLLIVDEEQRFGVSHKEKLKQFKTRVDCITMSATPIPRTLQMSLLGIRDMSIIATPPPGRLAVRTHIAKFSDNVIREAVMRELSRGGQAYIVHNRVKTIHELADHLRELLPEARIAVGHGQMKEQELEKVMIGFVRRDFNVLLSTTIIESGLDISNANTMLIDRADNFGLSQLYQLRGRIGRSRERAYCYLLVRNKRLTDVAQQRLDVIERFSDLGSGFQVASYDLEIRGAGNILGPEQSGSVEAVGLDLYTELLEEAIAEVRGEEVDSDVEPEVNVPVPAYIPEGYIHDTSLRLLFYKRLSLARDQDELDDLYTELHDRFGDPPAEVEALREVISITIDLKQLRCPRLDAGPGVIQVTLGDQPALTPDEVISMIHLFRGRYVLTPKMHLLRHLKPSEAEDPLKAARLVCRELMEAAGFA